MLYGYGSNFTGVRLLRCRFTIQRNVHRIDTTLNGVIRMACISIHSGDDCCRSLSKEGACKDDCNWILDNDYDYDDGKCNLQYQEGGQGLS
jgi:hypothetical protein